jgi:transcriptional regulator with XRE-family HTH domain
LPLTFRFMGRPCEKSRTTFGRRLHAARLAAGLSQAEVASRLGIKQAAYAAWERYPVAIRPEQIEKTAHILKTPVKDLFERTPRSFMQCGPAGRARRAFEAVGELNRHQQKSILEVVEMLLIRHRHPKFKRAPVVRTPVAPQSHQQPEA